MKKLLAIFAFSVFAFWAFGQYIGNGPYPTGGVGSVVTNGNNTFTTNSTNTFNGPVNLNGTVIAGSLTVTQLTATQINGLGNTNAGYFFLQDANSNQVFTISNNQVWSTNFNWAITNGSLTVTQSGVAGGANFVMLSGSNVTVGGVVGAYALLSSNAAIVGATLTITNSILCPTSPPTTVSGANVTLNLTNGDVVFFTNNNFTLAAPIPGPAGVICKGTMMVSNSSASVASVTAPTWKVVKGYAANSSSTLVVTNAAWGRFKWESLAGQFTNLEYQPVQ